MEKLLGWRISSADLSLTISIWTVLMILVTLLTFLKLGTCLSARLNWGFITKVSLPAMLLYGWASEAMYFGRWTDFDPFFNAPLILLLFCFSSVSYCTIHFAIILTFIWQSWKPSCFRLTFVSQTLKTSPSPPLPRSLQGTSNMNKNICSSPKNTNLVLNGKLAHACQLLVIKNKMFTYV